MATIEQDLVEEEEKDPIEECKDFVVEHVAEVLKSVKWIECLFNKFQETVTLFQKESNADRVALRKRVEQLEEKVNGLQGITDKIQKGTAGKADQKKIGEIENQITYINFELQSAKIKNDGVDSQLQNLEKDLKELTETGVAEHINESINDNLTKFINGGLAGIGRTLRTDDSAYVASDLLSVSETDVSNFFQEVESSTPKIGIAD